MRSLLVSVPWVLVLLAAPAHAMYYMDDTNSSIQYIGTNWSHLNGTTQPWIKNPSVYNSTLTHSTCEEHDDCRVIIPFTGSGITIYNVIRSPFNISVNIDGSLPTFFNFTCDRSCLNASRLGCFNSSIYNTQFLVYGDHFVDIAMLTLPSWATNLSYTDFYFDYATVNETRTDVTSPPSIILPAPTTPSTINSTSPVISSAAAVNNSGLLTPCAIAGLAIGLILFAVVVLIIIYCIQKRRRRRGRVQPEATSQFSRPGSAPSTDVEHKSLASHPKQSDRATVGTPDSSHANTTATLALGKGSGDIRTQSDAHPGVDGSEDTNSKNVLTAVAL